MRQWKGLEGEGDFRGGWNERRGLEEKFGVKKTCCYCWDVGRSRG